MGYYQEEIIQQLLDRSDIVDLVGRFLALRPRGQNYLALCPFHKEKTPSMVVSPQKQIFHCFGCGVGGNALRFVQLFHKLSFPEAVEKLADLTHFTLPRNEKEKEKQTRYDLLYKANEWLSAYYRSQFNDSHPMLKDWLNKRKLTPFICDLFKLGYSGNDTSRLISSARQSGIDTNLLQQLGIISKNTGNGWYERFRDRVIFPIFDLKGRVVAFGGRILEDKPNTAKYINSPESPIYHKGDHLFGLWQSRETIHACQQAILVEGYMDFLALFQHGIKNGVASLGTALTLQQGRRLRQLCREVLIVYDSDRPGMAAAYRATEIFTVLDLPAKIVFLGEGEDPDSILSSHGVQFWNDLLGKATESADFRWFFLNKYEPEMTMNDRLDHYLSIVAKIDDPLNRQVFLDRAAVITGINRSILQEKVARSSSNKPLQSGLLHEEQKTAGLLIPAEERRLLSLILQYPDDYLERLRHDLPLSLVNPSSLRQWFQDLLDHNLEYDSQAEMIKSFINTLDDEALSATLREAAFAEVSPSECEELYRLTLHKMKLRYLEQELLSIRRTISQVEKDGNIEYLDHLIKRFNQLVNKKKELLDETMGSRTI